jgi:hypothetical protein
VINKTFTVSIFRSKNIPPITTVITAGNINEVENQVSEWELMLVQPDSRQHSTAHADKVFVIAFRPGQFYAKSLFYWDDIHGYLTP